MFNVHDDSKHGKSVYAIFISWMFHGSPLPSSSNPFGQPGLFGFLVLRVTNINGKKSAMTFITINKTYHDEISSWNFLVILIHAFDPCGPICSGT